MKESEWFQDVVARKLGALIGLVSLAFLGFAGAAHATDWPVTSVSASSAVWPASYLNDGNVATDWSSAAHSSPNGTEWVSYAFNTFYTVNYVKLYPRMAGNTALGFPVTFNVYWSNGSTWNLAQTFTNYPTPYRNDWIILPLGADVNASGILVIATTLGGDGTGHYYFQLGEVGAGYNSFFDHFVYQGNDGATNQIEIEGMGAGAFNPNKLAVWNYDQRNPIIVGKAGGIDNIYAPNVVYQSGSFWNIYFGGEDGTNDGLTDRISFLTSNNNFNVGSFSAHVPEIDHGSFVDVNNESVVRADSTYWEMLYTTLSPSGLNTTGYAISPDGAHWSPAAGSTSNLINMSGYPGWGTVSNVNGTNVLYYQNGAYYLYWKDQNPGLKLSSSWDGVNFGYDGELISDSAANTEFAGGCAGVNDMKSFASNSLFMWTYHCNTNKIWYSFSATPVAVGTPQVLFQSTKDAPISVGTWPNMTWANPEPGLNTGVPGNALDPFITSVGMVTDGTTLYGVVYGAGSNAALTQNAIYARWLQRKALFQNSFTGLQWADSIGPSNEILLMVPGQDVETGSLTIYDSDGATPLLSGSPEVTIRQGDVWAYRP